MKLPVKLARKLRKYRLVNRVGLEGVLSVIFLILDKVRWVENYRTTITALSQRIKEKPNSRWILY